MGEIFFFVLTWVVIGRRLSLGVRKNLFTQRVVSSGTGYPKML